MFWQCKPTSSFHNFYLDLGTHSPAGHECGGERPLKA